MENQKIPTVLSARFRRTVPKAADRNVSAAAKTGVLEILSNNLDVSRLTSAVNIITIESIVIERRMLEESRPKGCL
jgi:hypothetical protein